MAAPRPPLDDERSAPGIPLDDPLEKDVALRRTRRRILHRNVWYVGAVAMAVALTLLGLAALVRWTP